MSEHLQKFLGAMAGGGIGWEDRYEREMCGGGSTSIDYARLAGHYISLLNEVIGAVGLPRLQVLIEAMDDVRRPDLINALHNWSITYGRELCPTGADTYGEGVRACKEQVAAILRGHREWRPEFRMCFARVEDWNCNLPAGHVGPHQRPGACGP
ncbi:MAG: hypothetical protein V1755_08660 [Chloroflexota bacterium]